MLYGYGYVTVLGGGVSVDLGACSADPKLEKLMQSLSVFYGYVTAVLGVEYQLIWVPLRSCRLA